MTKPHYLWIEQYRGCGCSVGPVPKRDLLGYCATHGNNRLVAYPVPCNKREWAKAASRKAKSDA